MTLMLFFDGYEQCGSGSICLSWAEADDFIDEIRYDRRKLLDGLKLSVDENLVK